MDVSDAILSVGFVLLVVLFAEPGWGYLLARRNRGAEYLRYCARMLPWAVPAGIMASLVHAHTPAHVGWPLIALIVGAAAVGFRSQALRHPPLSPGERDRLPLEDASARPTPGDRFVTTLGTLCAPWGVLLFGQGIKEMAGIGAAAGIGLLVAWLARNTQGSRRRQWSSAVIHFLVLALLVGPPIKFGVGAAAALNLVTLLQSIGHLLASPRGRGLVSQRGAESRPAP